MKYSMEHGYSFDKNDIGYSISKIKESNYMVSLNKKLSIKQREWLDKLSIILTQKHTPMSVIYFYKKNEEHNVIIDKRGMRKVNSHNMIYVADFLYKLRGILKNGYYNMNDAEMLNIVGRYISETFLKTE